jgi:deoxyhypusine synthase
MFVNNGQEWEASDSGAKPNEALSWGKLRLDSEFVKVYGDANLALPLIVSGSELMNKEKHRRDIEFKESVRERRR